MTFQPTLFNALDGYIRTNRHYKNKSLTDDLLLQSATMESSLQLPNRACLALTTQISRSAIPFFIA